ncbi:sortase domain-bontaining protein [Streptomyces sp. JJ38]|uniref:sortase domain-containing protein n=1 Tax=Streptomyces sp. JJ38 TaxID=2738128 RepID=UPI001C561BE9|nr:sortase [Streptomyces sp. JJ38]MBW1596297.1 class F sortase [Streptomyces sp. JJ38]
MPEPPLGGRRGACTVAATACAATGVALIAFGLPTAGSPPPPPPRPAPAVTAPRAAPSGPPVQPLPRARPQRVRAPAIGLDVRTEPVGLDDDGSVALPDNADHAGWFTRTPAPGQSGNAVVVGHVDSDSGPAAFYGLGSLRPGDRIVVDRERGPAAEFTVSAATVYDRGDFPSSTVYGPTTEPRLTLVTCADWDPDRRTYRANLVVTARLAPPAEPRVRERPRTTR